jgi:hypothetical protein
VTLGVSSSSRLSFCVFSMVFPDFPGGGGVWTANWLLSLTLLRWSTLAGPFSPYHEGSRKQRDGSPQYIPIKTVLRLLGAVRPNVGSGAVPYTTIKGLRLGDSFRLALEMLSYGKWACYVSGYLL